MESVIVPVSGLVTFDSLPELRLYIKQLLSYYEREFDVYSQKVGTLMRTFEKVERGREMRRMANDNWQKVGMLLMNNKDPMLGSLEVMLEAMEEFKAKMARTNEVLVGFDLLEPFANSADSPVSLYLKNGVPIRVIFDAPALHIDLAPDSPKADESVYLSR